MKAFWWFEKDSVAGMARPGFNHLNWFDLTFDEASLLGWIGQYSNGQIPMESFRQHLTTYVPRIYHFHNLDEASGSKEIQIFNSEQGFKMVLSRLAEKIKIIDSFEIANDQLILKINEDRLVQEIEFIKTQGISKIVSLTEHHHNTDILSPHFSLHHIAIPDLGAPQSEQAEQLAELLNEAMINKEKIAIHCLAGLGRTSTMILAAYLIRGEPLESLQAKLAQQNPSFSLSETQKEFLTVVSQQINKR